jgi:hypothetical protein
VRARPPCLHPAQANATLVGVVGSFLNSVLDVLLSCRPFDAGVSRRVSASQVVDLQDSVSSVDVHVAGGVYVKP